MEDGGPGLPGMPDQYRSMRLETMVVSHQLQPEDSQQKTGHKDKRSQLEKKERK
jgi:hypothetical protein